MAVSLTGTGGLFTRLGVTFGELGRVVSGYGASLNSGVDAIYSQYPNSNNEAVDVAGLLTSRDNYRSVHTAYTSSLTTTASNTFIDQCNRDTPQSPKTLTTAATLLKTQMVGSGDSINKPTVSASVSAWGSNKGNAVVAATVTNQFGDQQDQLFAESTTLTVTADVSSGGSAFGETLTLVGQPAVDSTDYTWPAGSGASTTLRITDALVDGLIQDGSFELWTSSTPQKWTVATGAATVDKNSNTTYLIRGTYGLKITSDGSTLTAIRQQLSSAVTPNMVIGVNLWAAMSALDASGAVRIRLTDSSGTVLVDDAGNNQTYSRDTNGQIGTSLTNINTFFRTGRQLPTSGGVWLEIALTTTPSAGKIVYVDHVGVVAATLAYAGGPYVAAYSKNTSNAKGDYFTLSTTNNLGNRSFVRLLDRWLGLRKLGVYLPSSNSPTISDSLIS